MLNYKKILTLLTVTAALGAVIIPGCTKDVTVVINNKPVVTGPVSFKKQVLPILIADCAIQGCHVSGGKAPNLSLESAYSSLTTGNYLNLTAPSSSIIYERLTGKLTPGMPLTAPASDPSSINELVLAWITQGAKNN